MSSAEEPVDPFADPPPAVAPDPPATLREPLAALAAVTLFDLLIYRTGGYASAGLFLLGCVPLIALGSPFRGANWRGFAIVAGLLVLTAARLAWLGWGGAVLAGVVLLAALALTRSGRRVWTLDVAVLWLQTLPAAAAAVLNSRHLLRRESDRKSGPDVPPSAGSDEGTRHAARPWSVLLPVAAGLAFAGLFLLANPDLKATVGEWAARVSARFGDAIRWIVPGPGQTFLWVFVGGAALGLLRPLVRESLLDPLATLEDRERDRRRASAPAESIAYPAVRNTLLVVVGVFAAYLPFEFLTLWRRDFPAGFYYAGYAHEGAAWLTVALATATALLSALFRGSLLADPRADRVRRLAWIWSGLNFLLVAAVCNRLLIYVDFNGLSRLRVVGFLGIAAVAGGFAAVVAKIARDRGFAWLVRRQLRIAALVVLLGLLAPIDWIAHSYNAGRVSGGDPAPLALIGNHEIDLGGLLALEPLLHNKNPTIARGVAGRMTLAVDALDRPLSAYRTRGSIPPATERSGPPGRLGRFQLAEVQFRRMLARNRDRIGELLADRNAAEAAEKLADYGMRWW
ncbi:DUF4153 domain-containing protein [Alienimonas californiensis]|uniref:DUF4153 domain-containing protein n=1 Tax=Alienimonas californiensis TaxID=2527989 RepID=UPI0011AA2195|nr:DUF4153 domain-containing protein [Alienimonas californiensis]